MPYQAQSNPYLATQIVIYQNRENEGSQTASSTIMVALIHQILFSGLTWQRHPIVSLSRE